MILMTAATLIANNAGVATVAAVSQSGANFHTLKWLPP